MTNSCSTCTFWTGNRSDPQDGQCRRYPPSAAGIVPIQQQPNILRPGEQSVGFQPIFALPGTNGSFYCGEYQMALKLTS